MKIDALNSKSRAPVLLRGAVARKPIVIPYRANQGHVRILFLHSDVHTFPKCPPQTSLATCDLDQVHTPRHLPLFLPLSLSPSPSLSLHIFLPLSNTPTQSHTHTSLLPLTHTHSLLSFAPQTDSLSLRQTHTLSFSHIDPHTGTRTFHNK